MPVLPGSLRYGSNIFAVLEPSEPSTKPFRPPIGTQSSPKPTWTPSSASSFHAPSGQRRSTRTVSSPVRASF